MLSTFLSTWSRVRVRVRMCSWRIAIPLLQTVSARPYCLPYTVTKYSQLLLSVSPRKMKRLSLLPSRPVMGCRYLLLHIGRYGPVTLHDCMHLQETFFRLAWGYYGFQTSRKHNNTFFFLYFFPFFFF